VTAAIVITAVSPFLYRNRSLALRLNWLFAIYKALFKALLIAIGCVTTFAYSAEGTARPHPANRWRTVTGFFALLHTYRGREIPFHEHAAPPEKEQRSDSSEGQVRKGTLMQGGIAAIALVTLLCMLANVAVVCELEKMRWDLAADHIAFSYGRSTVRDPRRRRRNGRGKFIETSPESWGADPHR